MAQTDGKASACNAGFLGLIPGSGRSPREGNGNPLQYSCLENPMVRGTWRAIVHKVAKNQTRLKQLSLQAHTAVWYQEKSEQCEIFCRSVNEGYQVKLESYSVREKLCCFLIWFLLYSTCTKQISADWSSLMPKSVQSTAEQQVKPSWLRMPIS